MKRLMPWLSALCVVIFGGLFFGLALLREEPSPFDPGPLMSREEVMAALYAGDRGWCTEPRHRGGCLSAERATKIEGDRVSTEVLDIVRAEKVNERIVLTVRVFSSDLIWRGDRLCEDPSTPLTAARIGFYTTGGLKIDPSAELRPASDADLDAYLGGRALEGEACFRYRRTEIIGDRLYDQITYLDGEPYGDIYTFSVFDDWREINLTMVE